jgi:hypothetical protein
VAHDHISGACVRTALEAGRRIRDLVHAMPPIERAQPTTSILKPHGGYGARKVDAAAEALALEHLDRLSHEISYPIAVLVESDPPTFHRVGLAHGPVVWTCMDAIDGTVKIAGLGAPAGDRVAVGNDGGWAAAFAFTAPTDAHPAMLRLGDFTTAVVVDGNPTRYRAYPQDLVVHPAGDGLRTIEVTDDTERRVYTSTTTDLSQSMVFLDVFQAYDLATRQDGDDLLGVALYALLTNRHAGGAFDVLRQYANLSALGRVLFGWREPPVWLESQGGAYVVVNENLANLIPAVALVAGAGGLSVDFAGHPLRERRLVDGRTSVIHAANETLCRHLLALVEQAELVRHRFRPAS